MRHNQNGRRFRGRNNGQGHQNGGHNNGNGRRVNPRMQTFDSNGPDVRIRGNAHQINEKYVALARDAASAGDRVLAESYLQHAEYYQRLINEMTEEYSRNNPQPQQQSQQQQPMTGNEPQPDIPEDAKELNDLDQGFLVGNKRRGNGKGNGEDVSDAAEVEEGGDEKPARRANGRVREAETA
ncbi:MAG: DUF4167 domain-containing protein [Alphaproteobacteria bacterium]|nr:DUF4167 domain-containing protein [Alphaproteobacteria bacterium]